MITSKVLLKFHDVSGIQSLDVYRKHSGYEAMAKAAEIGPDQVVAMTRDAGLRGRGGAGFSTAVKWQAVREQPKEPHYFVCNIAEGEPGSFKDRELLKNPHMILESVAIAAFAIGAQKAFIYLRGIFIEETAALQVALHDAQNRIRQTLKVEIVIHRGEDSYIAGEETAMLESLEGKPAIPRVKPPRPYQEGLWESPTAVNNVETVCNIIPILLNGPKGFRLHGTVDSPGTKLFCLSGQVRRPGVYEFPLGTKLSVLLHEAGEGPHPGRKFVAIFPGGPSTPILRYDPDLKMDFESVHRAGSHLGTGGIIVIDDSSDLRDVAAETSSFFMRESCGVCPPCAIGTKELYKIFSSNPLDLLKIREFCEMMKYRGQCAHSRAAAQTSLSFLNQFPEIFTTETRSTRS